STIPAWTPKPTIRLVNWSMTTNTQSVRSSADSHRNMSTLHRLSLRVTEERQPRRTARARVRSITGRKDTAHHVLIDFGTKGECDLLGDARTTPVGLRRLISTMALTSSLDGPL